jgi:hypothetical protein
MSWRADLVRNRRADNEPPWAVDDLVVCSAAASPDLYGRSIGKCRVRAPQVRFALVPLQVRASQAPLHGVGPSQTNLGQVEGLRSVPGLPNSVAYCRTRSCIQSLVRVLSDL